MRHSSTGDSRQRKNSSLPGLKLPFDQRDKTGNKNETTAAAGFFLSLHLQHIKGLSPQAAGFILVAQPVVMALTTLVPSILLNAQTSFWAIVLYLVILGCGFGLFSSPNTNAVMSAVERKSYGVASATATHLTAPSPPTPAPRR